MRSSQSVRSVEPRFYSPPFPTSSAMLPSNGKLLVTKSISSISAAQTPFPRSLGNGSETRCRVVEVSLAYSPVLSLDCMRARVNKLHEGSRVSLDAV